MDRELLTEHRPGRAPICGFVCYISPDQPILMRRMGWEVSDDIHDDFEDSISRDNGRTWSEARPSMRSQKVDGGVLAYVEYAALYLPKRQKLLVATNQIFERSLTGGADLNTSLSKLHITLSDPLDSQTDATPPFVSDFGLPQGLIVSFSRPIEDRHGRILLPVQWQKNDPDGTLRGEHFPCREDMPDVLQNVWDTALLIGETNADDSVSWRLGSAVPWTIGTSSRGIFEGAVAELSDGRLAMIMRGSNSIHHQPGYKWLSFSSDGGQSWSLAEPLPFDDGTTPESSSTGSSLFRSFIDGQLYWIGNLCLDGRHPIANFPREPLFIARVQEEPFALIRDSIRTIDFRHEGEGEQLQLSNFKFYQERGSGDIILYLTRYGTQPDQDMLQSDQYLYRVSLTSPAK